MTLSAETGGPNRVSHGSDHTSSIPRPEPSKQLIQQPRPLMSTETTASLLQPSHIQDLQTLTNNVDIPTLSKILAFTYQKEANHKNQLLTRLTSDLQNKEDGLTFVLSKQKDLEFQLETAYQDIENLQKRIKVLEQQGEDLQGDARQVNVLHYLKIFDGKLNLLIKGNQEDDGSRTRTYTKHIDEDHQLERSQLQRRQPMSKVEDKSAEEQQSPLVMRDRTEHAVESQELPYIGGPRHGFLDPLLDQIAGKHESQVSKPQDSQATNIEESQELYYVGQERPNLDSQHDESKSAEVTVPPSTPIADTQNTQAVESSSRQGSVRGNKFDKRKRTIAQDDGDRDIYDTRFKKPANYLSKPTSKKLRSTADVAKTAHEVDDRLPRSKRPLADRNISTLQIQSSQKSKASRGSGGG